jgi:hypothetical protein
VNLAKATDLLDDRYGLGEALGGCQRLDRLRRPADDHERIRDDDGFRALGDATRLPEDYVNAYYLEDLKRPVSVARVDGRL